MPNPAPAIPARAPVLGWFPRKKFVSLQPGQFARAVTELCASAALIPAMKASPTHHFQSLNQRLGLGSACARLPESSTAASNNAMRQCVLISAFRGPHLAQCMGAKEYDEGPTLRREQVQFQVDLQTNWLNHFRINASGSSEGALSFGASRNSRVETFLLGIFQSGHRVTLFCTSKCVIQASAPLRVHDAV